MPSELLKAKISVPHLRTEVLPRQDVASGIEAAFNAGRRLALLWAPPGYGKTTFLATWAQSSPHRTAWLTLDQYDDDLQRFLTYLFGAVHQAIANADAGLALPPGSMGQFSPEMLTPLLNQIAEQEAPLAIVLDDYHLVHNQAIHHAITYLIENAPLQLRVLIATRSTPALPLPRWRARKVMVEIRSESLRFMPAETAALLEMRLGFLPAEKDLEALHKRVEGWVAALELACASLRRTGSECMPDLVHALRGNQRHIYDYLAQEVFEQQAVEIQHFLLQTCILDRLTGPLCDAVIEGSAGAGEASLQRIERENALLQPIDDERMWYRYQPLFADFLRTRLKQEDPLAVATLHRRAAAWHARTRLTIEAVHHALQANAGDLAAQLVAEASPDMLARGEVGVLAGWLAALSPDVVHSDVRLSLATAWVRVISMELCEDFGELLEHVWRLSEYAPPPLRTDIQAQLLAIRAMGANVLHQTDEVIATSQAALAALPAGDDVLRSILAFNLGNALRQQGHWEGAGHAFDQAHDAAQRSTNLIIALWSSFQRAELHLLRGELQRAAELHQASLALSRKIEPMPALRGLAYVGLGTIQWEQYDLEGAVRNLETAVDLCREAGVPIGAATALGYLALVRQAAHDARRSQSALIAATTLARGLDDDEAIDWMRLVEVQYALGAGNLQALRHWIAERVPRLNSSVELRWFGSLLLTRAYLALGEPVRAQRELDRFRPAHDDRFAGLDPIPALVLQAQIHIKHGESMRALAPLKAAVLLAEPEGFVRVFVDGGADMHNALTQLAGNEGGVTRRYIGVLLERFGDRLPPVLSLTDPLTERELELLRLLSTQMTSGAIADYLTISSHTVRTHVKNIYAKLSVHGRYEAVERARALGLL